MTKPHQAGQYVCPRCGSNEAYQSEEVTGAMALSYDTPGPVDPTMVSAIKGKVMRCKDCGEKTNWVLSAEGRRAKARRETKANSVIGIIFGVVFSLLGLYLMGAGIPGTTIIMVGCFVIAAVFFGVGILSRSMRKNIPPN